MRREVRRCQDPPSQDAPTEWGPMACLMILATPRRELPPDQCVTAEAARIGILHLRGARPFALHADLEDSR